MENNMRYCSSSIISPELALPGFRFHPTDEDLVEYYLKETALGKSKSTSININIIGFLNIYNHPPWDLPALAIIGERKWYFFVARDKRNGKPNRTTDKGYWKATGSDRHIRSLHHPKRLVGLRKTLVFHTGKAPKGRRTDWVMNEYTLISSININPHPQEDIVLCKIYRKATSLRVLEQMAEHQYPASTYAQNHYLDTPFMSHLQDLDPNYNGVDLISDRTSPITNYAINYVLK